MVERDVSALLEQLISGWKNETDKSPVQARFAADARLLQIIVDHLTTAGTATRKDIDTVLSDQFEESLDNSQKVRKITYLLAKLRREGLIRNTGTKAKPEWVLVGVNL